ncbi:unnamed protein product [Victoria cruziana]
MAPSPGIGSYVKKPHFGVKRVDRHGFVKEGDTNTEFFSGFKIESSKTSGPPVSREENLELRRPVTEEEVREPALNMMSSKAPGTEAIGDFSNKIGRLVRKC